jgi:hypothetical protein
MRHHKSLEAQSEVRDFFSGELPATIYCRGGDAASSANQGHAAANITNRDHAATTIQEAKESQKDVEGAACTGEDNAATYH